MRNLILEWGEVITFLGVTNVGVTLRIPLVKAVDGGDSSMEIYL